MQRDWKDLDVMLVMMDEWDLCDADHAVADSDASGPPSFLRCMYGHTARHFIIPFIRL